MEEHHLKNGEKQHFFARIWSMRPKVRLIGAWYLVNLLSDLFFKPRSVEKSQEYSSKLAYIQRPLENILFIQNPDDAR
jgi:hypothetical protein